MCFFNWKLTRFSSFDLQSFNHHQSKGNNPLRIDNLEKRQFEKMIFLKYVYIF